MNQPAAISAQTLIFLAAVIGAALGAVGSIVAVWITKHYEDRRQKRDLFVRAAIENWKLGYELAKKQSALIQPLDDFVVHWLLYSDLVAGHHFRSADDVVERLKELQTVAGAVLKWRKDEHAKDQAAKASPGPEAQ